MTTANNVTRLLDARKIPYVIHELPIAKLGAAETATLLRLDPMTVYKTIVVTRERGKPILVVIPGPHRVDLKMLAACLGEKKLFLPTEKEAERITGLQAGGISPLALLNKSLTVVIAAEAERQLELHISGGQRGLNICLAVKHLAELTRARFAEISIIECAQDEH